MPLPQIANSVQQFFPAPGTGNPTAASNLAAVWRVLKGGRRTVKITAHDSDLVVTLDVSADNSTYANTAATPNITAVVNATVAQGTTKVYDLLFRDGKDSYVRLLASGGGKGEIQFDGGVAVVP